MSNEKKSKKDKDKDVKKKKAKDSTQELGDDDLSKVSGGGGCDGGPGYNHHDDN